MGEYWDKVLVVGREEAELGLSKGCLFVCLFVGTVVVLLLSMYLVNWFVGLRF